MIDVATAIRIPPEHCPARGTLILYEVIPLRSAAPPFAWTTGLEPIGTYCTVHFHIERDRIRAEGRRTGVEVLEQPGICIAPASSPPPAA